MLLRAQYGRLQCCTAHGSKGRRTIAFGGYEDNAEEQLMKYALKMLKKLAQKYPTQVSRGLHELVAKAYGDALPPHLYLIDEEEVQDLIPYQPPSNRFLVAGRTRLARSRTAAE